MRPTSCLLLIAVAGCSTPSTDKVVLICDTAHPCGENMECVNGFCQGSQGSDLSPADMPDLLTPMGACAAGNGDVLGTDVEACPGTFPEGNASKLCNQGYHVCANANGISLTTCNLLSGFFVANVPAYYVLPNRNTPLCGASPNPNALFFGCGKAQSYVIDTPGAPCSGYSRNIDCGPAKVWKCSAPYSLDKLANTEAADGVLCCKG